MREDWLWLCSLPGFYRQDLQKLLQFFEAPERVRAAPRGMIAAAPFLREQQKEQLIRWQRKAPEEISQSLQQKQIGFCCFEEESYPESLRHLPDYPYGLFYLGQLPQPTERCVAVIGARMCTPYGRHAAEEIAGELAAAGISVVSGMAYGIDGIAQRKALEAGGCSYAVVGCGVDICYPREHGRLYRMLCEQGGVLSEYPPGTPAIAFHFPMRNRIISGLSECVIVTEAKRRSGSLITADLALDQGKEVLALPGRLGDVLSEGCNSLIAQGAGIITSVEDLKKSLGLQDTKVKKTKKNTNMLASSENMVYSCLDFRPKSLSEILKLVPFSAQETMQALTGLLMKNMAEEIAKNYYVVKK